MIDKEDVLKIAQELSLSPTDSQVQEIIDEHESAGGNDPTATWDLIVEQQLYEKCN